MDYNKLDELRASRNVTKKTLYDYLGVTQQTFNNYFTKKTLTVHSLEKLAAFFEVPVTIFFQDKSLLVNEPEGQYGCSQCSNYRGQIRILKEMIIEKDIRIEHLSRELGNSRTSEKNGVA